MDPICLGDIGFDIRLAHKHGVGQTFLDIMGWGGHVYGRGAYFAEAALYSHWWFARNYASMDDKGAEQYTQILAQVFTGRSKDYGPVWAPDLCVEPPGYHSVCGTESDQKVLPVVRSQSSLQLLPGIVISIVISFALDTLLTFTLSHILTLSACEHMMFFYLRAFGCSKQQPL